VNTFKCNYLTSLHFKWLSSLHCAMKLQWRFWWANLVMCNVLDCNCNEVYSGSWGLGASDELIGWVAGCLANYVGDNATFLHVIAQKLQNGRIWNSVCKCSLAWRWCLYVVCVDFFLIYYRPSHMKNIQCLMPWLDRCKESQVDSSKPTGWYELFSCMLRLAPRAPDHLLYICKVDTFYLSEFCHFLSSFIWLFAT